MTGADRLPGALRTFVELFNGEQYWESHEALEVAWRERRSDFYQGLILYASAFVHAQRGNPHGILAQLGKAVVRLTPYAPAYLGVDIEELLAHAGRCRVRVEAGEPVRLIRIAIDEAMIRGDEPELSAGGQELG